MIWVINMNSGHCCIYHYSKNPQQLNLAKVIESPYARLKTQDIVSDKPGQYQSGKTGRGTYAPPVEAKEIEIDNFCRGVAKTLENSRKVNDFDKLIIISPPHVNGLLQGHLTKHTKENILNTIQKDLIHLKEIELLDYLKKFARFPD